VGKIIPFPAPLRDAHRRFPTPPHFIQRVVWDKTRYCRFCGSPFIWGLSDGGTWVPLAVDENDPGSLVPHLPRCPSAVRISDFGKGGE